MTRSRIFTLGVALIVAGTLLTTHAAARQAGVADARLQAALTKEVVEGKCDEAIPLYEQVLTTPAVSRPTAAKALLHLAGCQEKTGRVEDARSNYRRLITQYPDSRTSVTEAQARLAALPGGRGAASVSPSFAPSRALDFLEPSPWTLGSFVSPNGEYALIESDRGEPNGYQYLVRHLGTGREIVVAQTGAAVVWRWSPDSTRIAFVVGTQLGEGRFRRELHLVSSTSAERKIVAAATVDRDFGASTIPAWSPDGKQIAVSFVARRSPQEPAPIYLAAAPLFDSREVGASAVSPANLTWSHDGTRLVFRAPDASTASEEFRTLDIATGNQIPARIPSASPEVTTGLMSSPSPDSVVAVQSKPGGGSVSVSTFLVPLGSGEPRLLFQGDSLTAEFHGVLPDGKSMIVRDLNLKRFVLRNIDTGNDQPLTTGSGEEQWHVLSPDKRLVAFTSNRDGTWALYAVPLDRIPVQNPIRIASLDRNPSRSRNIGWLSNGLLYYTFGFKDSQLTRINLDPKTGKSIGPPIRLNTDLTEKDHPAVSPDGKSIASWSRSGSTTGISIMTASGAGDRMVLDHPMVDVVGLRFGQWGTSLFWKSDTELLFYEWLEDRQPGLTVLDVRRGTSTPVPHVTPFDLGRWDLSYAARRQEVVYVTLGRIGFEGEVRARSLVDGKERTIAKGMSLSSSLAVSPDASAVAYMHAGDRSKGIPAELRIAQLDGSGDRILLSDPDGRPTFAGCGLCVSAWSPDGRFLLHTNLAGKQAILNVQTRESWPLFQQDGADWGEGTWSPDGSFIVLRRYAFTNEWRAFDGVTYDAVIKSMSGRR